MIDMTMASGMVAVMAVAISRLGHCSVDNAASL